MPHQDHSSGSPAIGPSALGPALDWLVRSELFGSYPLRGDSVFTPATMVRLVLRWAWSEQATLTDRFAHAQQVIASPAGDQHRSFTYQAFVKLLRRRSACLLYAVVKTLQERVRESLTDSYRVTGYLSVAGVLRVLRKAMRSAAVRLEYELAEALIDGHQRQNKASRDYPRKKSNLPGDQPPLIIDANQRLIAIARQIRGFTA